MCRPTCSSNDYLDSPPGGLARKLRHQLGSPVSRDHALFVIDAKMLERLHSVTHRFPVGLAAHENSDARFFAGIHAARIGAWAEVNATPLGGAEKLCEKFH